MAGGKETPRQKMIGMMYLVLTALLAMNISKDVLNAFIQINKGLGKTNEILDQKSQATIDAINSSTEGAKAVPFQQKVVEVDQWTDAMMAYIEEMKARVMASSMKGNADGTGFEEFMIDGKAIYADTKNADGKLIVSTPDENQNNTALLVGAEPQTPKDGPFSAKELRMKLEEFRDKLMGISVIVAVLANLAKVQTDVMNAKNNVCMSLAGGINASDLKFTDVTVAVVPKQSYVLRGDEFEAEIYLAAYNKSSQTKVYMGGEYKGENAPAVFDPAGRAALTSDSEGKCHFKTNTGGMSLGSHGYSGQIAYMKDGKEAYIPFVVPPFFVGEPALVISPVQMNVFYRGLENPVEISVPGVSQDQVEATCSGCASFSKGQNGQWIVKPGAEKDAKISVSATINGEKKSIGVKDFRVKPIPDPIPSFNGKKPTDGTITQGELSVASGIRADMSNFDFNVTVRAKSFVITIGTASGGVKEYNNPGNTLTDGNKEVLKKAKKGEKIFIEKIMVDMPDGTTRQLSNINLKVV